MSVPVETYKHTSASEYLFDWSTTIKLHGVCVRRQTISVRSERKIKQEKIVVREHNEYAQNYEHSHIVGTICPHEFQNGKKPIPTYT